MTLQEVEAAPRLNTLEASELAPVESWASEAPLKLVAWALDSMGRTAKSTEIRQKLEGGLFRGLNWKTWWGRVLPAVKQSRRFNVKTNNYITLLSNVDAIPAEPWDSLPVPVKKAKTKTVSVADWKKWLLSDVPGPPPGPRPTKPVCNALAKLSKRDIQPAMHRTMWGAGEFLASGSPTAQAAAGWAEAVSRGFIRSRELSEPDAVLSLSPQVGALLPKLVKVAKFSEESVTMLLAAGELPGEPDPWWREFTAGMWQAFQDTGAARELVDKVPDESGSGRAALARELATAALHAGNPLQYHAELDRVLDNLWPRDRLHIFNDLIVRSANRAASRQAVLDYVAASRHAAGLQNPAERLNLLVMASLLLSDGHGRVVDEAAQQIGVAVAKHGDNGIGLVWPALLSGARQHIADLRAQHAQELENQRLTYEADLEEMRREAEGLRERVAGLRSLIAEKREESRMDIRQDMLMVTAETLQSLRLNRDSPDSILRNVEVKLALALRAGGSEEFGMIGDIVPYNPKLHQADRLTSNDSNVRIRTPGALVRGKLTGDRVLIKARVVQLSEAD